MGMVSQLLTLRHAQQRPCVWIRKIHRIFAKVTEHPSGSILDHGPISCGRFPPVAVVVLHLCAARLSPFGIDRRDPASGTTERFGSTATAAWRLADQWAPLFEKFPALA